MENERGHKLPMSVRKTVTELKFFYTYLKRSKRILLKSLSDKSIIYVKWTNYLKNSLIKLIQEEIENCIASFS